jgi:hypothetical protein
MWTPVFVDAGYFHVHPVAVTTPLCHTEYRDLLRP